MSKSTNIDIDKLESEKGNLENELNELKSILDSGEYEYEYYNDLKRDIELKEEEIKAKERLIQGCIKVNDFFNK